MDPELILVVLVLFAGGPALMATGCPDWRVPPHPSSREWERRCWRALWLPLMPGAFITCALVGWAIVEPDPADEYLTTRVVVAALPFGLIWARAVARASWSAWQPARGVVAATVGLLRPTVVISAALEALLDRPTLAAVREHEKAHADHRDPLRIWLAQLVTDLQWPWPAADRRMRCWRRALEMARDDEVRRGGTDGLDLAEAILAAARLTVGDNRAVATLLEDPSSFRERVERLMVPLSDRYEREPSSAARSVVFAGLGCALIAGATFGDPIVAALLRALA